MSHDYSSIQSLLKEDAEKLLDFDTPKIYKEHLHFPSPHFLDDIFSISDRSKKVIENLVSKKA